MEEASRRRIPTSDRSPQEAPVDLFEKLPAGGGERLVLGGEKQEPEKRPVSDDLTDTLCGLVGLSVSLGSSTQFFVQETEVDEHRDELGPRVSVFVRRERAPDLRPGDTGTKREKIHIVIFSKCSPGNELCTSSRPAVHCQLEGAAEKRGGSGNDKTGRPAPGTSDVARSAGQRIVLQFA